MKSIELKQFLDFKFLGKLKTSPNKTRFGFIKSEAKEEKNEYNHTLYVSTEGKIKKIKQLKTNQDFVFLNDDLLLLDLQKNQTERNHLKKNQKKSFYYYDLKEEKLSPAFTLPFNGSVIDVIDENTLLVSAMLKESDHVLYEETGKKRSSYLEGKEKQTAYEDIKDIPYYFNGRSFVTGQNNQIFTYDIKSKKLSCLLEPTFTVEDVILSNDHKRLIYTGNDHESVMSHTTKVYAYDLEKQSVNVLYDQDKYTVMHIADLGKLVLLATDMTYYGLNQNPDVYELVDGEMRLLSYYGFSYGGSVGTDCRLLGSPQAAEIDDKLYFISTLDDHTDIKSVDVEGKVETELVFDGSIDGFVEMKDYFVLIAMKGQALQELYRLDFDGTLTKLTDFNEKVLKNKYIAKPREVLVKKGSHDVKGFVLLPKDYDENKQYPMVLDIHGGPKTVYGQIYYHEMQYWVSQGYIVIYANPRGSDGKGNDFADIRGKYGTIDYEDLMDFVNQTVWEYPAINQDELYVTGGSYGGFMTNWIVGHTDRFRAAVTQRSISNWLSFYGTSDIGYFFASDQTDGHPIYDLDKLYEQSPIKYTANVHTPLRFIHSDKDYRCPMEQAQQFYAVLKTKGLDTDLIWFKDETHELSRGGKPQARIKRLMDITDWFEKH